MGVYSMRYVMANIADIHWGAMPAERLYGELTVFIKELIDLPKLDLVAVDGDLFNNRLSVNGDHAKLCMKFCADLFRVCIDKDAKLIFIKGTESHDNDQLNLLYSMKKMTECDFEIYETVTDVEILPDLHCLMLPEEYMSNMEEYYAPYFDNKMYDFIFGHGMVDKASFIASLQESEFTRPNAPIFEADRLSDVTYGAIYFGHIHKGMEYRKFRYVSSFTRWAFGESESKGFYITEYDTETRSIINERFVENVLAPRFDTVSVYEDSGTFDESPHEITQKLLKFADNHKRDYLRIKVFIPDDYKEPKLLTTLLNESFRNPKVKIMISNNQKVKEQKRAKEEINELKEKYKIIFDRKADIPSKIHEFIKLDLGRNIDIDKIKSYLKIEEVRE